MSAFRGAEFLLLTVWQRAVICGRKGMKEHTREGSCSFSTRVCQSAESRDSGTQLAPSPFFFLFQPGTLVHTLVASTFRMCLPPSIHLLQGSPQQHASWVIPNSCVLTVKIAHHSSTSLLSVHSFSSCLYKLLGRSFGCNVMDTCYMEVFRQPTTDEWKLTNQLHAASLH